MEKTREVAIGLLVVGFVLVMISRATITSAAIGVRDTFIIINYVGLFFVLASCAVFLYKSTVDYKAKSNAKKTTTSRGADIADVLHHPDVKKFIRNLPSDAHKVARTEHTYMKRIGKKGDVHRYFVPSGKGYKVLGDSHHGEHNRAEQTLRKFESRTKQSYDLHHNKPLKAGGPKYKPKKNYKK